MRLFTIILIIGAIQSCSLLHHQDTFELERLSEDVLISKSSSGISIEITKIPSKSGN